jgi:5-methylcytosine-specific restriction endonuclease McrA
MVECPTCEREDFVSQHAVKIHHAVVHGESLTKVSLECKWCGESFQEYPSLAEKSEKDFCSHDCYALWVEAEQPKESAPRWSGGLETVSCENCGDCVEKKTHRVKNSKCNFCSIECRAEHMRGENAPNWRGGYEPYYGPTWNPQRRKALQRDDYECQDCGMTRDEHHDEYGTDLEVHHKTPIRTFEDTQIANQLSNLITLCTSCHSQREASTKMKV